MQTTVRTQTAAAMRSYLVTAMTVASIRYKTARGILAY